MKSANKVVVIALILGALLLISLGFLSRDTNKQNFISWTNMLDSLNLLTYEMDSELLKLRSGLSSNYDQITKIVSQTEMLMKIIKQREFDDQALSESRIPLISQPVLTADTAVLHDLVRHRLDLAEKFKTKIFESRKSEVIAERYLMELQSAEVSEAGWGWEDNLLALEKTVSQMESSTNNEYVTIIDQLMALTKAPDQLKQLERFRVHLDGMNKNVFRIRILVVGLLRSSESIKEEISQLNDGLVQDYKNLSGKAAIFQWLLFAQALLYVFYGAYQARKAVNFSRLLAHQNAQLDAKVQERTKELEAETAQKQNVIKTLKSNERALAASNRKREELIHSIDGVVWSSTANRDAGYTFVSDQASAVFGFKPEELMRPVGVLDKFIHRDDMGIVESAFAAAEQSGNNKFQVEYRYKLDDERIIYIRNIVTIVRDAGDAGDAGKVLGYSGIMFDVTKFKMMTQKNRGMEAQLRQSQKLEAVGQLAAGIAHEINTPAQFVGDNIHYFQDTFADLDELFAQHDALFKLLAEEPLGDAAKEQVEKIETLSKKIDLAFIREDVPNAIGQALDGIQRITTIVKAMKEFSHPGGVSKESIDLNKAINSTLTVARNEWKYLAHMVTELDPGLPMVTCLPGEINQTVLNMVVNAAHAIEERQKQEGTTDLGTITIKTMVEDNYVVIHISDTGKGIKPENLAKVFDPFFTTKQVGKGTGQGLYIAHSVIVEKHNGQLDVESEPGVGTCFKIKLPIEVDASEETEQLKHAS